MEEEEEGLLDFRMNGMRWDTGRDRGRSKTDDLWLCNSILEFWLMASGNLALSYCFMLISTGSSFLTILC